MNRRFDVLVATIAFATAAPLLSQKAQVIPAGLGLDQKYGNSVASDWFSPVGVGDTMMLYSHSGVGLPDKAIIREIAMRPSAPSRLILEKGEAYLTIQLGFPASGVVAERIPADRASVVAGGLRGLTTVASSRVSLPAFDMRTSPRQFAIKIPIHPFVYDASRGGLVVQIRGYLTSATSMYTVDAYRAESDAVAAKLKQGLFADCILSGRQPNVVPGDSKTLVPGGVGAILASGFNTAQVMVFAGLPVGAPYPLDLSAIGMKGCRLHTAPIVLLPLRLDEWRRGYGGYAYLQLPNDPRLSGALLRLQAFEFDFFANAAGITLANGFEVEVGKGGARAYRVRTIHGGSRYYERIDSRESGLVLQLGY